MCVRLCEERGERGELVITIMLRVLEEVIKIDNLCMGYIESLITLVRLSVFPLVHQHSIWISFQEG
jgi:hypothetical protein